MISPSKQSQIITIVLTWGLGVVRVETGSLHKNKFRVFTRCARCFFFAMPRESSLNRTVPGTKKFLMYLSSLQNVLGIQYPTLSNIYFFSTCSGFLTISSSKTLRIQKGPKCWPLKKGDEIHHQTQHRDRRTFRPEARRHRRIGVWLVCFAHPRRYRSEYWCTWKNKGHQWLTSIHLTQ